MFSHHKTSSERSENRIVSPYPASFLDHFLGKLPKDLIPYSSSAIILEDTKTQCSIVNKIDIFQF